MQWNDLTINVFTMEAVREDSVMTRKMMKILAAITFALAAITVTLPVSAASAEIKTSGDYEYMILDDGTAALKGYNGKETRLVIPSEIDGYTVTSIGGQAFWNQYDLTSVDIPDSVTKIDLWAFSDCTGLTEVNIPDSVTQIMNGAFDNCYSLKSVTLPDSVTRIESETFENCYSLETVRNIKNVEKIGSKAFANCISLSIEIPATAVVSSDSFTEYADESQYSYEIYCLSEVSQDIYSDCGNLLYIKTENPDPSSFEVAGCYRMECSPKCSDIEYKSGVDTDGSDNCIAAVEGGYVLGFRPINYGGIKFIIEEKNSETGEISIAYNATISVKSFAESAAEWRTSIINEVTDDSMSNFQKMSAISAYLLKNFKYLENIRGDGDEDGKLVSYASLSAPYFICYRWDSALSPSVLCQFAEDIGGFDVIDNLFGHYANYGLTWEIGHYYCYCEAGGKHGYYMACPLKSTGIVSEYTIDLTDSSNLYSINGLTTHTHTYGSWTTLRNASCERKIIDNYVCKIRGIQAKKCSTCGAMIIKTTPALEHTKSDWIISGNKRYKKCTVCGEILDEEDFTGLNKKANKIKAKNIYASYSKKKRTVKLSAKATGGKLSYKSSSKKVKVSSSGKITIAAKFSGTATITVTAKDISGKYQTATKKIKVTVPKTTSVKSLKNTSGKKATVKWKKVSGVSGYQIQVAAKKNFSGKKTVNVSGAKKVTKKLTGLKKGKKAYVRIRTYKTVSGKKYYSAWSAVKSVKIKK